MLKRRIPLEPAALAVCESSAVPPLIYQLPPAQGRMKLNRAQDAAVYKYPASISYANVDTGTWGEIKVYFVRPEPSPKTPNVIFYIHGAGWVFGNVHTHEKLVRELAARTGCVVVFPEYSLSPEAKYPTAVEQCYYTLSALPALRKKYGLDFSLEKLTVAGDSVGGNMAAVMTILANALNGPKIHKQLLYYPVTNADFNTESYLQFAEDYYLYRDGMMWFWDQYTTSAQDRESITASPLRAGIAQLRGLPAAMIVTDEADVLRDEGEAYAGKLLQAGVDVTSVRVRAVIHDFVMLNALDQTNACRSAMDLSTAWINRKNKE